MRKACPQWWAIVASLIVGCSTMRPQASQHPGVTDRNPNATIRAFPATATLVAQRLTDVMSGDPILDHVALVADLSNREYRNFSRADRQALGISQLTLANDVNFNITARSKDGHPVIAAVRLKGESGSEVSILYGSGGDPDLSRDLLDKAEAALAASPPKDPGTVKAAGPDPSATRPAAR